MKSYHHDSIQNNLEALPPLKDTPGYTIISGDPRAGIRFDQGGFDSKHRLGIWQCSPGEFSCVEKGDELQILLQGDLTLIYPDGSEHHFIPGDSFFTEKGETVIWRVNQTVKKVFFTYDRDGK